jgi:Zn-finger nucleic acid-binding protein
VTVKRFDVTGFIQPHTKKKGEVTIKVFLCPSCGGIHIFRGEIEKLKKKSKLKKKLDGCRLSICVYG